MGEAGPGPWYGRRRVVVPAAALLLVAVVAALSVRDDEPLATSETAPTTTEAPTAPGTGTETTRAPATTGAPTSTTAPAPATTPPGSVEVLSVEGSDDTLAGNFSTDGAWEISWDITGGTGVVVTIRDPEGNPVGSTAPGPGTGRSPFGDSCQGCLLDIDTSGASYRLVVTDLPD